MFRAPFDESLAPNAETDSKAAEKFAFLSKTFFEKIREKY